MDRRLFLKSAMVLPIACSESASLADGRPADDVYTRSPSRLFESASNATQQFVHLRLHTEYSLLDSIIRVPELMHRVAAEGMPAVALTDEGNLFAMVKFYKAGLDAGIKPLIGVDAWIRDGRDAPPCRAVFLCQNLDGYRNLTQLVTRSSRAKGRGSTPMLERHWLKPEELQGLIVLSGGPDGDIGQGFVLGQDDKAARCLDRWLGLCGDRFYLEVQRTSRALEQVSSDATLELARRRGVAAVATNDVRFLRRADFDAHEARVCIHDGTRLADPTRSRRYSPEQYLKSPAEMARLFADTPELLVNAVDVARRCSLDLKPGSRLLPAYPVSRGLTAEQHLCAESHGGLLARLAESRARRDIEPDLAVYAERLKLELRTICSRGFATYFLIVADFVRWARGNGVAVSPGRGSSPGSLVAYALGITDPDPIEHDLLFERFLNAESASMPDIDVDFCMKGRDRVIDYVAGKYGRERVSQIVTFSTLAPKAAVRDAGRILSHDYDYGNKLAELIPFEIGITLDKALFQQQELRRLYETEDDVRELIDLARALEGLARDARTHAGGLIIASAALTDFAPIYGEQGGATSIAQLDRHDAEAAGLVTFDFLGLRALTLLDSALRDINAARARVGEPPLAISALRLDDAPTYRLIRNCDTEGIFQLQSRGIRDLIRRLQPDQFGDIAALAALNRPGPLAAGMVDDFIARKHDISGVMVDCLHPALQPVLEPTHGLILYQEQVMQIAHVLAGYSLSEADLLRRAFAKEHREDMALHRSRFLSHAIARRIDPVQAKRIIESIEQVASFAFSKSHATAYALLTYQTAWLKAHYREAFSAAVQRESES